MTRLIDTRMTARMDGDFVVFLIGMRMNRWWKPWRWIPVARAMRRMIAELEARPELGLLGHEQWFGRTTLMVQYWRSLDHLMDYARARDAEHLPAWRRFNQLLRHTGDVGIWHETFAVPAGGYEAVYQHMPLFGLARVGQPVEARGSLHSARGRLGEPQADPRQPREQADPSEPPAAHAA